MNIKSPFLIKFDAIGASEIGFLSVAESKNNIPFELKRIFWSYFTPQNITRGRHAHYETQMMIVAVNGRIQVTTELINGEKGSFLLDSPKIGLYLPPLCWHVLQYSHDAVQLVMTSTEYQDYDYIRDYDEFKSLKYAK
jgi:dTDP-4-dehydrorhamnose 3,5-epimerase-like enzyme